LFSETFTERNLPLLDKAKAMGFHAIDILPFDLERFPTKQVRQRAADLGLDIQYPFCLRKSRFLPGVRIAGTFSKAI
jgi:sugar phosphate isomerase/epimerase